MEVLLLIGMGLLHLGITARILRVAIGLMTVLSGFEIIYATVEGSILVAALLAVINLGLALVGSYLLIASNTQEEQNRYERADSLDHHPYCSGGLPALYQQSACAEHAGRLDSPWSWH